MNSIRNGLTFSLFPTVSRFPQDHTEGFPPNLAGCLVRTAIHITLSLPDRCPIVSEHPQGSEARIQHQLRSQDNPLRMRRLPTLTKRKPSGNARPLGLSVMQMAHSETTEPCQQYRPMLDVFPGAPPMNEQVLLQNR